METNVYKKMLEKEAETSTRLNVLTSDQYRGLIDEVSPLSYFYSIEGYVRYYWTKSTYT